MARVKDIPTVSTFEFPVYEVITPHTKQSFLMQSMTVAQESILKESAVSTVKALSIINQTIFECAKNKVAPYNTLDGFEKNLTLGDRKALLAGLFIATYGDVQDFTLTCPSCGHEMKIKADVAANLSVDFYDGDDSFIDKRLNVELPVSKWIAVLKAPTLADEKAFTMTRGISREVLGKWEDYQVIDKLIVPGFETTDTNEKIDKTLVYSNIADIYTKFTSLPARDRKAVFKAWTDVFGKAKVTITIPVTCDDCGTETKYPIEPIEEIFRNLQ